MSEYTNYDGLTRRYGVTEAQKARVWENPSLDRLKLEMLVDADFLPASDADPEGLGNGVIIATRFVKVPLGYRLISGDFQIDEAFDSDNDTATLTVSLVDADDSTSNAFVIVNAATAAQLTAGLHKEGDDALDGAGFGTVVTGDSPKYVRLAVGVQSFTAGRGKINLEFAVPEKSGDTLGNPQPSA